MSIRVGLDLGSAAIKVVFTENGEFLWRGVAPTVPGQEAVARALINDGLAETGLGLACVSRVTSTGYGKKLYPPAGANMDEITANALGAAKLSDGKARAIINVGGQDVKVIFVDERGAVRDFKMNDKCAAGTGRFLELAARILDAPVAEFDALARRSTREVEINSTCAVFAESEIVSLLVRGMPKEDIIKAIYVSAARRISALAAGCAENETVYLDGGAALNRVLAEALEEEMMLEVRVFEHPQFTVAYGAAISLF